jgi:thioredoxin-like negative regulator of GroEL
MKRHPIRQTRTLITCGLALVLMAGGAGAAPSRADEAVQQARQAARADRHADAIAAFDQALAAAPSRRREWLLEYADQHTWAGRLDAAIALYREAGAALDPAGQQRARLGLARALAWAGRHNEALAAYDRELALNPTQREAQLGRARVLSWTHQQAQALAQYEAVLRDHPGDDEAVRGMGRVQSWRGRHRAAADRMQQFLRRRPHDREATLILAESLLWMGRADRALTVLRAQRAADSSDERAAALLQKLELGLRPETSVDWRDFDQSDDLRVNELAFATRVPLAGGRGQIGPRYSIARYRPPRGPVSEIEVQRPGVEARYRFSDALEWNGLLALDLIDTRGAGGDHARWTHDTYVTWWPSDLLRFDLGSARWTFDSEETLRQGLAATQSKFSVDVLPDELTRLTARVSQASYSDGNQREGWQLEAERRLWHTPRINLGYRHTQYDFTTPGQRGYYNPDQYRSDEATVSASGWMRAGVNWTLRWAIGRENEQPGGARPIRSGSASVTWAAHTDLVVEAAYDYATSRTLSTGGFARGIGRVTVRYRH